MKVYQIYYCSFKQNKPQYHFFNFQDILTDLNAEGETLPLNPQREEWIGHKGMVQAAQYILEKLDEEQLIEKAKNHRPDRGTKEFEIVIVGHSLGKYIYFQ